MEDIIIGTWWLVALEDGRRYLTKASKVIRRAGGSFTHSPDQMSGWVGLDDGLQGLLFTKEGPKKVKSEYFKGFSICPFLKAFIDSSIFILMFLAMLNASLS